jgi:ABC-type thiamine transport system ATPase subunit
MSEKIKSMTNVLSGGERQRVALARSIVSKKNILLLDEPLSQLDPHLRKDMLRLIKKIKEERNLTVIMVVHTPEEVIEYVDNFIQIDNGRVIKSIKPNELDIANVY